ncbi:lymphocyte antigen 75 [Bicyclus anynana]|uniref:Lymphocyte antigen 75 n=1 Tax=Bicyclus anynana TaxID=110368 RepID=A0A6J1MPL8_BICAN|nr:lymphocyte antigen 75 [Bicyclus anynana]
MTKTVKILLISDIRWCLYFIFTILMLPSSTSKQYRTDYVYNRRTDAFYKFHMEMVLCGATKDICAVEGATLMVPTSEEDISQVHGMFKQYPDIGDLAWVGYDGNDHDSIEETPLINLDEGRVTPYPRSYTTSVCDVVKRNGETYRYKGQHLLPFICKANAKDVFEDKQCKVFGRGYRYYENVGSCYKIPSLAYEWNAAYAECHAEGAHLIVLNSELEHQVIYNFTNEEHQVRNAWTSWFFLAGVRAEKPPAGAPVVFKTIFNQSLEEAGYSQWSENEPNNSNGHEYCVTIFKNDGKYNDIYCRDKYAFICEKELTNN